MNTRAKIVRVAALLPTLQNASSEAIVTRAAIAFVSGMSLTANLEQRRATATQSGPPSAGAPGPVSPNVASSPLDAFQSKLQSKTEQEIFKLMEEARAAKQAAGTATVEQEETQEEEEVPNPDTGEMYGPRGREPTRYGDWENKGKCIDF